MAWILGFDVGDHKVSRIHLNNLLCGKNIEE
jgi:hypothetical protein